MKQFVFVLILIFGNTAFSQQIDSLHVMYYVGYDCRYTIDSIELRGGCENRSEIRYNNKNRSYQIMSFVSNRKFREWSGEWELKADSITGKKTRNWKSGFGPNLIVDSIKNLSSLRNRKISTKELDDFLRRICSIQTDTVFPYSINDIPERFLANNSISRESCEIEDIDSLLQEEFHSISMSSVIDHLSLFFKIEGVSYCLIKSSNNYDWTLLISDTDKRKQFVYFAFDAFLLDELPKKFSGKQVLK